MAMRAPCIFLLLPLFSLSQASRKTLPISPISSAFSSESASDRLRRAALIRSLWGHPTELQQAAKESIGISNNAEFQSAKITRIAAAAKRSNITSTAALIEYPKGKPRKDPCKAGASDAKPTPYELKTQGQDISKGDDLRKYSTPCKPPPFILADKLLAPGLPTIPVPPPIEMPFPFEPSRQEENPGWSGGDSIYGKVDALAYAAAVNALKQS